MTGGDESRRALARARGEQSERAADDEADKKHAIMPVFMAWPDKSATTIFELLILR